MALSLGDPLNPGWAAGSSPFRVLASRLAGRVSIGFAGREQFIQATGLSRGAAALSLLPGKSSAGRAKVWVGLHRWD